MITFFNITESMLDTIPFTEDSLYYCSDSGNVYLDSPLEGARKKMSIDTIIVDTEASRAAIIAPLPNKIYCVLETGCMYIYTGAKWNRLGTGQFTISNVSVTLPDSKMISDSRITNVDKGEFIPDFSVADLVTSSSVTCNSGYAIISIESDADDGTIIYGSLRIN